MEIYTCFADFFVVYLLTNTMLFARVQALPLALLVQEGSYKYIPLAKGTAHGNLKLFCTKIKVNSLLVPVLCLKKKKMSFSNFIVAVYFTTFESLIVYRNTHRPCV